ncbi:hypothetical protein GJ689_00360 [Rhodoplanes serenus]|jgi:hypothetical protein|uniref:Uncharacterized protein n=1 Tax=Rhodoplanes serenus TaxID=200615 RepID=A0A327KFW6_9BRAD|nr:hypothetical protein [Rhodoplanes serenus]MBI5114030.1 hypothetical protein [Rhodovulum sp.]MTW14667.1 hypothetical protein [Rhodoplanes serenus]RAI34128.1 hypothetical protein CH340_10035 [Rhodoplanes serenus]VCU07073.1 hypothetical protein RHODGE_RHODGE_00377 [Rhodoplanes serenus]
MIGAWKRGRRVVEVPCTVEIERTADSLHAHVDLHGIEIAPGDEVIVHDAPTSIPFGESSIVHTRATVVLAGRFERLWARLAGYFELTELYEVGFSPGRTR